MSMSEMDQGEPESKDDKIEEVIQLNNHGNKLTGNLQLPSASDSNSHTNMEIEHWHRASENTNSNVSGGLSQGKKRAAHLMGSNILDDSVPQSKVPRLSVLSMATCSNNDRAHPVGASVCTINQLQDNKKATEPMVSKDIELTVTSDVDMLTQNDDQQLSIALEDSRINKDKELIRVVRYGTNGELKNLLDLCQNKISFQLSQETLEFCLIQAVRRGQEVKVQQLVDAGAQPASNFKDKDGYTALLVAAKKGFTDIARFLLEKGANVNAINNNKNSALILSMKSSGSSELVKLLLSYKANVILKNHYGFTALMKALKVRDFDTCQLLVDAVAYVNRSNRDGISLMELVKSEYEVQTSITTLGITKVLFQIRARNCSNWESYLKAMRKAIKDMKHTALCIAINVGLVDFSKLLNNIGAHLDLPTAAKKLIIALEDSRINKNKKLIRVVRYGTNDELKNLLDLYQNKISFQLLQTTLDFCLIQAIRRGQQVKVQQLVYAGARPSNNFKDKDGYTALLVAAENGFSDIARFLLEKGANVNAINDNKDSALILSVKSSGSSELVKLLLYHKANVILKNKYGFTALMKALEVRDFDTCQLLVDAGAEVNRSSRDGIALMELVKSECEVQTCITTLEMTKLLLKIRARNCSSWKSYLKAMYKAIQEMKLDALIALNVEQVDCSKLLMNRTAHLDLPIAVKLTVRNTQNAAVQFIASQYKIDVNKYNLLHLAIKKSMEDIVSILISLEADVNKEDRDGKSPLEVALSSQAGESIIKCLIQNGACVNGSGNFVPLHWSIRYSVEITKLLLDSGADVNAREIIDNDTALIAACDFIGLDMEIVKFLLARGAQPNLQIEMGFTALHKAIRQGNIPLTQLLVESGADLEIQTHDYRTAYLLAASEGCIEVIEAVQNLGANISAVDYRGYNALMLAIKFAQTSSFLYLASNGADINHQSNKGYTALMLAAKAKEWELLKSLPNLGADVNITASVGLGRNVTALSILLENSSYHSLCYDEVLELIRHGAVNSLPKPYNDVLHEIIAMGKRKMIQLLLANGMAPTISSHKFNSYMPIYTYPMPVFQFTQVSPLAVALACDKIWEAQYLIRNWALCPCDLNFLSLKELRCFLVAHHKSKSVEIVDKLLCQPASLLQLSFITMSHALGGVPWRENRINSLPLPQAIKKKLMFREEAVHSDLTTLL